MAEKKAGFLFYILAWLFIPEAPVLEESKEAA